MRKRERQIGDEEIQEILGQGVICRLGLFDGKYPYIVPMNYGYRNGRIYVHCAAEGRKIDILKMHDRVCVEVDADVRIVRGDTPCRWTTKYRSVIGFGRARVLEGEAETKAGLDVILAQHGGAPGEEYDGKSLRLTRVIEVDLERVTGKQSA